MRIVIDGQQHENTVPWPTEAAHGVELSIYASIFGTRSCRTPYIQRLLAVQGNIAAKGLRAA